MSPIPSMFSTIEDPPPLQQTVDMGLAERPKKSAVVTDGSLSPPPLDEDGSLSGGLEDTRPVQEPVEFPRNVKVPDQTLFVSRPLCIEEPKEFDAKLTFVRTGGQWCLTVVEGWDVLTERDIGRIRSRVLGVGFGQLNRIRRTGKTLVAQGVKVNFKDKDV